MEEPGGVVERGCHEHDVVRLRSVPFTNDRSEKMRLLCVNSTALGLPVVPDVDRMQATSSDVMGGGYSIGS